MKSRIRCYLRTHRRRWDLSQEELAFLVHFASASVISRCEICEHPPSVRLLVACEIIFGCHPSEIFPMLYAEIEEEVMRRGHELYEQLEAGEGVESSAKRDLLLEMVARERFLKSTETP